MKKIIFGVVVVAAVISAFAIGSRMYKINPENPRSNDPGQTPGVTINNRAEFADMAVFTKQQDVNDYLIFSQNGVETLITKATRSPGYSGLHSLFSNLEFSPYGNYVKFSIAAGGMTSNSMIYNIKNKSIEQKLFPLPNGFTGDEKYFYSCLDNAEWNKFYGRIYSVPDFKVIYETSLPIEEVKRIPLQETVISDHLRCEYDKDKKVVRFIASNSKTKIDRIIEYSFITNKAETK